MNLFGDEYQSDPMGVYERLRKEHGQVAPVLLAGDVPAWLVLGYRENLEVARTPNRFSHDSRLWRELKEGRVSPDNPVLPIVGWNASCVFAEGEEHERLRSAVTDSLGRFDRRGIRRHITRYTNLLVDQFCADGQADLVSQFAEHLPMLVMAHLVGMTDDYGPRLAKAALSLVKGTGDVLAADQFITESIREVVRRKQVSPGADLASWLLGHQAKLTEEEVVQHLRLIMIAANETTITLIKNTLRMVLADRRFRASLAGGHMTLPDAVEHVLWNEPPLAVNPGRWATSDVTLGGQQIKAGDMLLLGLAAGNTDPAIRPDLDAPMYGNRSHLAFSSGPHECPGQDIGRAITDTGIDALLTRLPDMRLSVPEDELTWISSWMSRHLVTLPVEFTKRKPESAKTEPQRSTGATPPPATQATGGQAAGGRQAGDGQVRGLQTAGVAATTAPTAPDTAPVPQRRSWWSALKRLFGGRG